MNDYKLNLEFFLLYMRESRVFGPVQPTEQFSLWYDKTHAARKRRNYRMIPTSSRKDKSKAIVSKEPQESYFCLSNSFVRSRPTLG
jgi:hypothetical protein